MFNHGFCVRKRECVCVSKTDKMCIFVRVSVCNGGFVCVKRKKKSMCVCGCLCSRRGIWPTD